MKRVEDMRIRNLTQEASDQMHIAMLNSLKSINAFFDSPENLKKDFSQELRVAGTVINAFGRIRQAEGGHEMVMFQLAKVMSSNKQEFRDRITETLPHLSLRRRLTK